MNLPDSAAPVPSFAGQPRSDQSAGKPMLSTREALDFLLAAARPVSTQPGGVEEVSTSSARNRVLAADVTSSLDVPPRDISAMDGYAVLASDVEPGRALHVSQRIPAGHPAGPLQPGTVARIFTGAQLPAGADAVVMQERATVHGDTVVFDLAPVSGECINRRGADIRKEALILPSGTRLTPQALGLAASVGCATLPVARRLKVAVFFTGDELTMPGEPLREGAIYNSSRFTLGALLADLGCDVTDLGIIPDRLDATRSTLRAAAAEHDLIVTSGGVSVGEEDHVRPAVEAEGTLNMWQIAMKPGKPLAFGTIRRTGERAGGQADDASGGAYFIGLPGNPVSSFVTFLLFVRPFILRVAGVQQVEPRALALRADFTQSKADRRNEFLRAKINDRGGLDLFANQSSAVLTSTVWADGLIDNPPNHAIQAGETVRFLPFSSLLG
jgi:molybdopterin molybdotransferase